MKKQMKEETNKVKNDEMNENKITLDKETSEVMNEYMNQETYQVKKKEMSEKSKENNGKEQRHEWINELRNIPSKEKRNGWKRTKKHTMIRNDEMNEKNKEIKEQWRKKYAK
jgi:hypothetical protein